MTDSEIDAVVASAWAAVRAIEEGNARLDSLSDEASFEQVAAVSEETRVKALQAFDQAGAERFLKREELLSDFAGHREHRDAGFVRETMNRVAALELHRRFDVITQEFLNLLGSRPKEDQVGVEVEAALEAKIKKLQRLDQDARALLAQDSSKANRDRLKHFLGQLDESIVDAKQMQTWIGGSVARQKFLASGGIEVTARQLYKEFDANEIAALQKYGGRRILITGKIDRIAADLQDEPVVHLATGSMFQTVLITDVPVAVAAELKKGEDFKAFCENVGEVVGSPTCRVVPFQ